MVNIAIKETAHDRRVAFRARDFVVVIKERGWQHFHDSLKAPPAAEPAPCTCKAGAQ